jgi:hypothetical protein
MAAVKAADVQQLARTHTRAQFIELCPFPFLVGTTQLSRPHQPGRTVLVSAADREGMLTPRPRRQSGSTNLMVLPVRKVQEAFPSMITVGRTNNNDVVIEDIQVSKFHAFFRVAPERLELADAGSRNGTFIGGIRLETKGAAKPVRNGESVRFGRVELILVDAGACWDRLR